MTIKPQKPTRLSRLVEICAAALRPNAEAVAYLAKTRGLADRTLDEERVGWCSRRVAEEFCRDVPEGWGQDADYIVKCLAGKLVFPIRDDCGELVAIATRHPGPEVKGWWNSPFEKEMCVYGLDKAREAAFARNMLYLVEGYVDVLYLRQAGLPNVAGIMSTHLSMNAAAVIMRYCDEICACFDADVPKEGQAAGSGDTGLKLLVDEYNRHGYFSSIWAISLPLLRDAGGKPRGQDPDEFVAAHSLAEFLALQRHVSRRQR